VVEPIVVDSTDAIARGKNEIDMVSGLMRLGKPVRERDLGAIPGITQRGQRAIEVGALDEEIEVLRVANDSGVLEIRVLSPHEEGDMRVAQHVERAPIKRVGVATGIVERRLIRHSALEMQEKG
jgi:hypothetical protein